MAPSLADQLRDAKDARVLARQDAMREEASRVCDLLVAKARALAFDAVTGADCDDAAVTVTYASRLFHTVHEYSQAVRSEVEARFERENVRITGIKLGDVSLGRDVDSCADDGLFVVASVLCCCLPLVCYVIPCCAYRACTRMRPTVRCTVSLRAMAPWQEPTQGVVVVGTPIVEIKHAVVQCA